MTPDDIRLVKDSFAKVAPISDKAAEIFYGRLFSVAPEVKPMFSGDMRKQGAMLMKAIGLAVSSLDNLEPVVDTIRAMGRRHVAYGAKPAHYAVVGDCLLWTLEQGLGADFTPQTRQAWATAYQILADVMIEEYNKSLAA